MTASARRRLLDLPAALEIALIAGARDTQPVRGLTHGFYRGFPADPSQPRQFAAFRGALTAVPTNVRFQGVISTDRRNTF